MEDLFASTAKKDAEFVNYTFRVYKDIKEDFFKFCESKNVEPAVVLRRFMENSVKPESK